MYQKKNSSCHHAGDDRQFSAPYRRLNTLTVAWAPCWSSVGAPRSSNKESWPLGTSCSGLSEVSTVARNRDATGPNRQPPLSNSLWTKLCIFRFCNLNLATSSCKLQARTNWNDLSSTRNRYVSCFCFVSVASEDDNLHDQQMHRCLTWRLGIALESAHLPLTSQCKKRTCIASHTDQIGPPQEFGLTVNGMRPQTRCVCWQGQFFTMLPTSESSGAVYSIVLRL